MKAHREDDESSPRASHEEQGEEQDRVSNTLGTVERVVQILGAFGPVDAERIERAISRYRLDHAQCTAIAQSVHRQGDLGSVFSAEDWFEMKADAATEHRVSV